MDELLPVTVFLGVFSGYFLALIAPEELRDGKYYFEVFRNISMSVFVLMLLLQISNSYIVSGLVTIIIFYMLYKLQYVGLVYILSGFTLYFIDSVFILTASGMLFLTGMCLASILAVDYEKHEKIIHKKELLIHTLKNYSWFLVLALLPFFFSYL